MIIEIFSFLSRIISLSIRLTANIISGHILINIINKYWINIFLLFPILILELGVALIQAYVFALLIGFYLKEIYEH